MTEEVFTEFMNTQVETIQRYIDEQRGRGDTRDENTLAAQWIEQHAAAFRTSWSGRARG